MNCKTRIVITVSAVAVLATAVFVAVWILLTKSNPWNARSIGEIPVPVGYSRVNANPESHTTFMRDLPLKKRGSKVMLYTGGIARLQFLSAAVIDMPVLSNDEQCADMTMRMRAEYLWKNGRYNDICFTDLSGKKHQYMGGSSRKAFEKYMRMVYGVCNTSSVFRETTPRSIKDVQPGDVLVYPSRHKGRYGHAILVADVAHSRNGKVAILCVEGNTPAREAHVIRKPYSLRNPWFTFKGDEQSINVSVFHFKKSELRHY